MIGITGSSGVLGKALLTTLRDMNIEVVAIGRSNAPGFGLYSWDLENPIPELFLDLDLIINCAYSFNIARKGRFCESNSNIEGSRKLAEWGKAHGKVIINPSSVNAALTMTKYGFEKKYIEDIMAGYGHINLRLGILDATPAIGLLDNLLNRPEFVPRILIDANRAFYVSDVKNIAHFIAKIHLKKEKLKYSNFYIVNDHKETLPNILKRLKPEQRFHYWNMRSFLLLIALAPFRPIVGLANNLYDQVLAVRNYDSAYVKNFEADWVFFNYF